MYILCLRAPVPRRLDRSIRKGIVLHSMENDAEGKWWVIERIDQDVPCPVKNWTEKDLLKSEYRSKVCCSPFGHIWGGAGYLHQCVFCNFIEEEK